MEEIYNMIINDEIIIKNYKCFDSNGDGFKKLMPINLIIGKNNSGKSSLIDLVHFLTSANNNILKQKRDGKETQVLIKHKFSTDEIASIIGSNSYEVNGNPISTKYLEQKLTNKFYTYFIKNRGQHDFINIEDADKIKNYNTYSIIIKALTDNVKTPLGEKTFCHITAERDIIPETCNFTNTLKLDPNGTGATNFISQIINKKNLERSLIEENLLVGLNEIINPDIFFKKILIETNGKEWEILFEDKNGESIALSQMGSGIKTILLVLLNLIVKPEVVKKKPSDFVFAFEELENNLHPALQRRLYKYIKEYSEDNNVYFFITTHSNLVIDIFGTYDRAQIIHIKNDGTKSTNKTIFSKKDTKQILKDLDIRASDILQSNGIIWVEGPSDRNYLNKWIYLLDSKLEEGLHYSIMFYGGRLLSNLTFDYEWFNKDIIPLMKINLNTFVIMDRDGKTIKAQLNETKKRIVEEIGNNCCWITKGREIENYLSNKTITDWLKEKYKYPISSFQNDINIKLENNIAKAKCSKKISLKYNTNKTIYSKEISGFINKESLNALDLIKNLKNLISCIKSWNNIN